ncbi:DnaB-like helicase C-terminal domain-containing protein [Streptomyces sp. NPDC029216]|uniref:replicative DNA helicase n=1 Tax=Streptomyces sp. NPDC029216 TaxID=3154701 RepID=UPI0033FA407F
MPDESVIPPGPHRDLLLAFHDVYAAAGRPGLRTIARGVTADDKLPSTLTHHVIGRVLGGSSVPSPRQAHALAAWLAEEAAAGAAPEAEVEQTVQRLVDLCRAVGPAAHAQAPGPAAGGQRGGRRDGGSSADAIADPGAVEAERRLLGAILMSSDAVADVVEILAADDFSLPVHQALYLGVLGLYGSGVEVTVPRVAAAVAADVDDIGLPAAEALAAELRALAPQPGSEELQTALEAVYRRAQLRRLVAAGNRMSALGTAALAADPAEATAHLDRAEAEFQHVFRDLERDGLGQSVDALERALDRIERVGAGADATVLTGFKDLDSLLGGLRPGHVMVLAGDSAIGKSTFALSLVRSAALAQGAATLHVSPDADEHETLLRLLSAEARVALDRMRSGGMTDEDWTRLARCMPGFAVAPLNFHDRTGVTVAGIRRLCRKLQRSSGLELLVVDPVQWIRLDDRSGRDDTGVVVRELAVMAKELRVPVVLVVQLASRPAGRSQEPPVLGELPPGLAENADTVVLLHREDAYDRLSPRAGEADLVVVKNRYGPTATITLAFQGHYGRFVDMVRPE